MMIRRLWALMLAGILAACLAGCGAGSSEDDAGTEESAAGTDESDDGASTEAGEGEEDSAESAELKTLRLGAGGNGEDLVLELGSLARANGYIEEELNAVGYTVEWYTFSSVGTEVNEALASGDIDGAFYGDFPAFTSKSNGIDTTIVATANQRMQYSIISANDEITSGEDLEGESVALLFGSVQQYFWERYVEETGIDDSGIDLINTNEASSLLQTGSADAAAANIYVQAYQESLGVGSIIAYGSDYDIFTTFVLTLKTEILEEDPEVGVALNKALIRAYEDAVADPEALYEAVATSTMTADVMKSEYVWDESLWYLSPEIADSTLAYYEELNEWMLTNGLISESVDAAAFIDTSYYETAVAELASEE